jgi:hypothetical protein
MLAIAGCVGWITPVTWTSGQHVGGRRGRPLEAGEQAAVDAEPGDALQHRRGGGVDGHAGIQAGGSGSLREASTSTASGS